MLTKRDPSRDLKTLEDGSDRLGVLVVTAATAEPAKLRTIEVEAK